MARKIKLGRAKMKLPRKIKQGDLIEVRATIRYPSTTGLKVVDEEKMIFGRDKPPVYLKLMEVFYGGERVTYFQMTSATSPDPLIRFKIKADKEAPIKIVFTNHKDESAEIEKKLKFS